jgi:nucleoside-diphosphate-sugar epimerase
MRVLLTGASGFVGSHVLARFLHAGEHTVAIVLRPGRAPHRIRHHLASVEIIAGDLARPQALAEPVRRFAPELVLHAAWAAPNTKNRDSAEHADHVSHTIELVKLAHAAGARHFVGLGSQAEYGAAANQADEEQPARPTTLYGTAKLCAGLLAGKLCATLGIRFAWLRLFAAYGPGEDPDWLIPSMCRAFLAGQRPATTRGEQVWDYLYVEDAAEAVHRVATSPSATGIFNLGSGRGHTVREVIERVRDLVDPGAPIGLGERPYAPDQVMHMEAKIDRLSLATGWRPEIDLATGLRRTVDWFRQPGQVSARKQ